jgi:hypothetical protein
VAIGRFPSLYFAVPCLPLCDHFHFTQQLGQWRDIEVALEQRRHDTKVCIGGIKQ